MNIHVTNNLVLPLVANIKIKDQSSTTIFSGTTDISGWKKWIICDQDIRYITGTLITRTPHTVTATKIAYENATTNQNMDRNRLVNIILNNDVTPPEPPTNLVFRDIGVNSINFSWTPPAQNDVYGFNIYINNTGSSTEFHLWGATQNSYYNITGLTEKTTYHFMIKSFDDVPWESTPLKGYNTTLDVTSPSPPTGLVAKNPTGHEITLSWVPNTESDLDGYCIYMNNTGTGFNGPYHEIVTVDSTNTQYIVTDLDEEVTYYFKIMACDEVPNYSLFSNIANATTLDVTPPRPPSGLEATALSGTTAYLQWEPNPEEDVEGYTIYYAYDAVHLEFEVLDTRYGNNTTYILDELTEKLTLHFKLIAFDEVPNNSSFSNVTTVTTLDETPPMPPTGLKVSNTSHNTLSLSWDPNIEPDVVGYILYRSNLPTGIYKPVNTELINQTEYNDTGLREFSKYYYMLKAVDDFQLESDFSEMAHGCTLHTPKPPEINVAPAKSRIGVVEKP
jgi:titin